MVIRAGCVLVSIHTTGGHPSWSHWPEVADVGSILTERYQRGGGNPSELLVLCPLWKHRLDVAKTSLRFGDVGKTKLAKFVVRRLLIVICLGQLSQVFPM